MVKKVDFIMILIELIHDSDVVSSMTLDIVYALRANFNHNTPPLTRE